MSEQSDLANLREEVTTCTLIASSLVYLSWNTSRDTYASGTIMTNRKAISTSF